MARLQLVWWWRFPSFSFWKYPRAESAYYEHLKVPIFYGLYLGIVEIRYFPERPKRLIGYSAIKVETV